MENLSDYTKDELRNLILDNLKETGIDFELIDIKVKSGPKITLSGEIGSKKEKNIVIQTIMDVLGIEEVIDDMEVIGGTFDNLEYDDNEDLLDDDNQSMGTEDIFRSLEDGLPYVPPTTSPFDEEPEETPRKKRRKGYGAF